MKGAGQIAYEAYTAHSEGRSLVSGAPLPEWSGLAEDIRAAWNAAGFAVLARVNTLLEEDGIDVQVLDAGEEAWVVADGTGT